jgi:hypothetical protein
MNRAFLKWLPRAYQCSTALVVDTFECKRLVKRRRPPKESLKSQSKQMVTLSPAGKALQKALGWQKLIEQESISRAEISRREGLSRARVTQLMSLLKLPEKVQQGMLAGAPEYSGWTMRRGLGEVSKQASGS